MCDLSFSSLITPGARGEINDENDCDGGTHDSESQICLGEQIEENNDDFRSEIDGLKDIDDEEDIIQSFDNFIDKMTPQFNKM